MSNNVYNFPIGVILESFKLSRSEAIKKAAEIGFLVAKSKELGFDLEFVSGDEIDAIDYFISKKILRKFEQLTIAYIRDEFDPFIKWLRDKFGKDKMFECIGYMEMLKKND